MKTQLKRDSVIRHHPFVLARQRADKTLSGSNKQPTETTVNGQPVIVGSKCSSHPIDPLKGGM